MSASDQLDVARCALDGVNLIEASAGTGKTWTICELYLRLLLERKLSVQQILVVTFTNAATAELRDRIRSRIVERLAALRAEPPLSAEPLPGAQPSPGAERQGWADRLQLALHAFDEASIFTIHGFCQRALADNPFAAGLPLTLELVEDGQELLMEAVNDFWRRHVAAATVAPEFARYLHEREDSPEKYAKLLKRHLAKPLARHLWPADDGTAPIDAAALAGPYRAARGAWLTDRDAIIALLRRSLPSLHGTPYNESSIHTAAERWDAICRDDAPLVHIDTRGATSNSKEKANLLRATTLTLRQKKNCVAPTHAFFQLADAFLDLRVRLAAGQLRARARLLGRLFDEAGSQLRLEKRARRVVSFDDMLSNVRERLEDPAYPWLAAAIRARCPAALIDEFQDTDPLQFDIFRRIYATREAGVFLVGDPKQAIYSFRHADLHTYLRAKRWAQRQWSLADNQRSSEKLLQALNTLFAANPQAFILPDLNYRRVGYGKKLRKRWVDQTEARAPLQVWQLPSGANGPLLKSAAKRAAAAATAGEIARLLEQAALGRITLDGEPLHPRDIAVLVRTHALGGEIKRALAALHVGSVEIGRSNIFGTVDARDLSTVLLAIAAPARAALVRGALATDLFGKDAAEIEAIAASETLLTAQIRQFTEYRDLWVDRGFGVMYRRLLGEETVARRLLLRPDGERRLTNFLHLGEILQQAEETHASPEALLRYFQAACAEENSSEAAQLRLESDHNLVQIVTIHTCKGLEYPVVFCPFLCEGRAKTGGPALEGDEYHDAELEPVIDFRDLPPDDPQQLQVEEKMRLEQAAESVRLLYVAVTRAVHRCYLVAGVYVASQSVKESTRSMLNWLVAGGGQSIEQWLAGTLTAAEVDAAWRTLARAGGGAIDVSALPAGIATPVTRRLAGAATLSLPAPPPATPVDWRLSSYSGLKFGAQSERAAGDYDARILATPAALAPAAGIAADDILHFPRGAAAGECIHAVFETVDFTDPAGWERAIATALATHPPTLTDSADPLPPQRLADMLRNLLKDVTAATLMPGLQLRSIPTSARLTELEFNFPVSRVTAGALNDTLADLGYRVPSLKFGQLTGYLKGFIDLIIEHRGRYIIVDWKSNHLGFSAADYASEPVARAMAEHGYHLQHLLYTVALDRYLRLRLRDYRYDAHFGGVLYLFVRGVRPAWAGGDGVSSGVYWHRPPATAVRLLNETLGAAAAPAGAA